MSDELKPHVSILELREAMEIGRDRERERIIKLLEQFANDLRDYNWQTGQMRYEQIQDAIKLIKGEQNG